MHATPFVLQKMASVISAHGLHTGSQFAAHTPMDTLDICAVAYIVAEHRTPPDVFFTDETASIQLIQASPRAMDAIKAISNVLDTPPCETRTADGLYEADYIEHVSNWAATPPIGATTPPTTSEVIGRILRAANHATQTVA
jgi:hypothetical protein